MNTPYDQNPLRNRRIFYKRCQEMAEYIHEAVTAHGRHVSDDELKTKFGSAQYHAFMREIRQLMTDDSAPGRMQTIEWVVKTRHFEHTGQLERRAMQAFWISCISLAVALATFVASLLKWLNII